MEPWCYLPNPWRQALIDLPHPLASTLEEIRFRVDRPVYLYGGSWNQPLAHPSVATRLSLGDIERIVEVLVEHSLYARVDELRHGYVTISGGHRVGIAGRAVIAGGKVETVRQITGLNMRVARQIKGVGETVLRQLWVREGAGSWLLAAPPRAGKTTLLRDLVRILADQGNRVVVIDERSEIAGVGASGISPFEMGCHTDVLDGWPKPAGIEIAIRTLGPDIVAVDELGGEEDLAAVAHARQAGARVIATVHARTPEDLLGRAAFSQAWRQGIFDAVVFLRRDPLVGTIDRIWTQASAPLPAQVLP